MINGQDVPQARPFPVSQVNRVALTPQLDGVIAKEEWEPLSSHESGPNFFQWEPDTLYWAAKAKIGEDVVVSLDYAGDGWLVGDDNIEFRISITGGTPTARIRRLDASNPNGPVWNERDIIPQSFKVAATTEGEIWSIETAWTPIFDQAPSVGRIVGVRVDTFPADGIEAAAFLPRSMGFVGLRWDNSQDLFVGLSWKPSFRVRSIAKDDDIRVRYEFGKAEDCPLMKSVAFRGEGFAADLISSATNPFPNFNSKGKVGVDYTSKIGQSATNGYRILRATVASADGQEAVLKSSFKIADLVDFDIRLPKVLEAKADAQVVRSSVHLLSMGLGRVEGTYTVEAPSEWTVSKGKDEKFLIYHSRGVARMPIELVIPSGTRGVFPITFKAQVGDRTMSKTIYMPIR